MNLRAVVALGLAGAGILTVVGAYSLTLLRRRRKKPEELERIRRQQLHRYGRLTTGEIVDIMEPESRGSQRLIIYQYEVAGVTYQVSQDITLLPAGALFESTPAGGKTGVKYDPQNPANSIVVCEGWSGFSNNGTKTSAVVVTDSP